MSLLHTHAHPTMWPVPKIHRYHDHEVDRRPSIDPGLTALPEWEPPAATSIPERSTKSSRFAPGLRFRGKDRSSAHKAAASQGSEGLKHVEDDITALPVIPPRRSHLLRISDHARTKVSEVSRGIGRLCSTKSDREPEQEASVPHDQRQSGSSKETTRETMKRHARRVLNAMSGKNTRRDALKEEMWNRL